MQNFDDILNRSTDIRLLNENSRWQKPNLIQILLTWILKEYFNIWKG